MSLQLDRVSRSFGGVAAVRDVSLLVPAGQITGLIGPNGAGKTTIINLITGMMDVSSGRIQVGETDITRSPPYDVARAGIARTFQNIRLFGEATVLQNVVVGFHRHERTSFLQSLLGLPASYRETRMLETRSNELLQQLGLDLFRNQLAAELSYGHQRKVEIARGMATNPQIFLLDEPVAGMNDVEAEQIGVLLRMLASRGIGILLIEHNMRFVMRLCDHIYVVNSGELITSGSPAEILRHPEVISAYLGA
jgi:branched-chain amino acid transport system ATP-binding protein